MYRIKESTGKDGKPVFTVQKNRKWIIPWKWHDCKVEVFCGAGTVLFKASFATREEAERYIRHKGGMVNGLIPGHPFYQD